MRLTHRTLNTSAPPRLPPACRPPCSYNLKFITTGKASENFKKPDFKKVAAGTCFSLYFDWQDASGAATTGCLDCELSDALPPTGNEEAVRNRIRGEHKKVRPRPHF